MTGSLFDDPLQKSGQSAIGAGLHPADEFGNEPSAVSMSSYGRLPPSAIAGRESHADTHSAALKPSGQPDSATMTSTCPMSLASPKARSLSLTPSIALAFTFLAAVEGARPRSRATCPTGQSIIWLIRTRNRAGIPSLTSSTASSGSSLNSSERGVDGSRREAKCRDSIFLTVAMHKPLQFIYVRTGSREIQVIANFAPRHHTRSTRTSSMVLAYCGLRGRRFRSST